MTEREVAEYLLNHKEELQKKIAGLYRPAYHLFPPAMQEIYLQQYEDGVVSIVRSELGALLNGEQLLTLVTRHLIKKVVPELLEQPESSCKQ